HGHVILANPVEFAGAVLPGGTTMAVTDTLPLMLLARPDRLAGLLEQLAELPMKFRWLIRLHPQSFAETGERFPLPQARTLRPRHNVAPHLDQARFARPAAGAHP